MNNRIIWQGKVQEAPDILKNDVSEDSYMTVFDTGDIVLMKSTSRLSKEQQRPLNEILLNMWKNLSEEEKKNVLIEECMIPRT